MPKNKQQSQDQDSQNNEDSDDSQNQLKINTDNSPKIIPVAKLPDKLKSKKIVINVSDTQYPIVAQIGQQLGWTVEQEQGIGDWDIWWTDREIQANTLYRMNLHQKINHFPGIYVLARKNLLGLHLMAMKKLFPNEYNFFPQTWMLPLQFPLFRQHFQSVQENKVRTYIVKPQALSQGRGIFLTRNIQDVINGRKYVVQKYLKNPLLLDGLKFDLRIYVLLAGTDPLRLYIYEQGLARLATRPYQTPTAQNLHENYIHLTNYSLNKSNPEYIFNKSDKEMDTGHKRSLKSVYERLNKNGVDIKKLKEQIEQSIIKTVISGLPSIRHQYQYCQPQEYQGNMCFHILGFDVMILDNLKPIVIEVNHTPSFQTGTPLDYTIKKNLIKDTLKLMRISIKHKKQLFMKSKQLTKKRVQTGKREILKGEKRRALLQKYQKLRDQQEYQILYDAQNPSGYKPIFPFKDDNKNQEYQKFYEAAEQVMKQLKDTRKKIISQQKLSIKQKNFSSKNINTSNKNSSLTKEKQIISQKLNGGRFSSLKIIDKSDGQQKSKPIILQERVTQSKQNIEEELQKGNHSNQYSKQKQSEITSVQEIEKNQSKIKVPQKKHIVNNNVRHPSTGNINSKYHQLINKFVSSNDFECQQHMAHQDNKISLEGKTLLEEKFSSKLGRRNSKNSFQQNKNQKQDHSLNFIFDKISNDSIKRQDIVIPSIKGYKHKIMPSIVQQVPVNLLKEQRSVKDFKLINYSQFNNKIKRQNKVSLALGQQHKINFVNLAVKPLLVENFIATKQTQMFGQEKQQKQNGKYVKPKTYNLYQNVQEKKHKNKVLRMGSQGFSVINSNKYQTEAIYQNKSMKNPINHESQSISQSIKNLSTNNIVSHDNRAYVSINKGILNSNHSNKINAYQNQSKPQSNNNKNTFSNIKGQINPLHYKNIPSLKTMVKKFKQASRQ